jgi:hypothetical protein
LDKFLSGLKKGVGKFYGRLVYFTAIWNMLWQFGIFCGHSAIFITPILVYFSRFGMLCQEKSGNPVQGSSADNKMFTKDLAMCGPTFCDNFERSHKNASKIVVAYILHF